MMTNFAKHTASELKTAEIACGTDSKGRARSLKIALVVHRYSEPTTAKCMVFAVTAEEGASEVVSYSVNYTAKRDGKSFGPGSCSRCATLAAAMRAFARVAKEGTTTYRPG